MVLQIVNSALSDMGNFSITNNSNFSINGNRLFKRNKSRSEILNTISIDDFIELWNDKLDLLTQRDFKNNKLQNMISNIDDRNIMINLTLFKSQIRDDILRKIKIIDNEVFVKDIISIFIFKDIICILTNEFLFYITLKELLNKNFTFEISDRMKLKNVPLINAEPNMIFRDIYFSEDFFIILTQKSQIKIEYYNNMLELKPTIKGTGYSFGTTFFGNDVILNIINRYENIFTISNLEKNENYEDVWTIRKFNNLILNTFNTNIFSNEIFESNFNFNDVLFFDVEKYTENEKIFNFLIKKNEYFLLYKSSYSTFGEEIKCDVKISNINFLFEISHLSDFKEFGQYRITHKGNNTFLYFEHNNIIWRIKLDGDDSEIEFICNITFNNTKYEISLYDEYIIFKFNDGDIVIDDKDFYIILSTKKYYNNVLYEIRDNIIEIIPMIPFTKNVLSGNIIENIDRIIYFYKINDEIEISNILNESKYLIGFFDRNNNYFKIR